MSAYDDESLYREEEAAVRFIETQIQQFANGPIFAYLAKYGDAVEQKVIKCRDEAKMLSSGSFYGAAVVRFVSAIEIAVRFFLCRPLMQCAFLPESWSDELTEILFSGSNGKDRQLLPVVLRNWDLNIEHLKLPDQRPMWPTLCNHVWPCRNQYVHAGTDPTIEDAVLAEQCLDVLLIQVVEPIAKQLGFTRSKTGCWANVAVEDGSAFNSVRRHETSSPSFSKYRKSSLNERS
jgi:hypothetical protein